MIIQQKVRGNLRGNLQRFLALARLKYRTHLKGRCFGFIYDNLLNEWKRVRIFQFEEDIDSLTFQWFQRVQPLNLPISGPLIQEKALSFAKSLKKDGFKASNGWVNRFKT